VLIGSFPQFLYSLLPYPVTYEPYTTTHILTQLQLLLFSVLGFTLLQVFKLYPPELRAINLDSDYLYRRLLPGVVQTVVRVGIPVRDKVSIATKRWLNHLTTIIKRLHTPDGILSRTWLTNSSVQIILLLLSIYLLYYFLQRLN
jgi:multicomponent Na+:H+ antiporter subunit D